MADQTPLLLDTNILKRVAQGNSLIAAALGRYLKALPRKVYIARAAYNELVVDAETPALRAAYRKALSDLKIRIAPKSSFNDRVSMYLDNDDDAEGSVQGYGKDPKTGAKTRPGDMFIAAEARALGYRLWTVDKRFAKRAAKLGIIVEDWNYKITDGVEDPNLIVERVTGKKSFRIPEIKVMARSVFGGMGGVVKRGVTRNLNTILTVGAYVGALMIKGQFQAEWNERTEKRFHKDIEEKLTASKEEIARWQLRLDPGEKLYANVKYEVSFALYEKDADAQEAARIMYRVAVVSIEYSFKSVSSERTWEGIDRVNKARSKITEIVSPMEIGIYTDEEMEIFWDLSAEFFRYQRESMEDPQNEVLKEQLAQVEEEIEYAFGIDIWDVTKSS